MSNTNSLGVITPAAYISTIGLSAGCIYLAQSATATPDEDTLNKLTKLAIGSGSINILVSIYLLYSVNKTISNANSSRSIVHLLPIATIAIACYLIAIAVRTQSIFQHLNITLYKDYAAQLSKAVYISSAILYTTLAAAGYQFYNTKGVKIAPTDRYISSETIRDKINRHFGRHRSRFD